jgi:hypothetical protein
VRLTERQARIRLGHAVAAAGGQSAFATCLPDKTPRAAANLVSRSLSGRNRISSPVLTALGLRRDAAGDIHTVEPPARIQVLAVRAAAALVAGILGPRP